MILNRYFRAESNFFGAQRLLVFNVCKEEKKKINAVQDFMQEKKVPTRGNLGAHH